VLFEPLGGGWVAFSSLSGESHLLNAESVAVVETLDLLQPRTAEEVTELLAADSGIPAAELTEKLADAWSMLLQAGLIREQNATACLQI
jgi:PqqD family protein of HPr-rel-A system